ncbi:MAG: iron ABC transporter permease [Abditibacteriota bacterium]|nr:iron ABC transporter permease [Abditibacteriota bacterium]
MKKKFIILLLITLIVIFVCSFFGVKNFTPRELFEEETRNLWLSMRLPRIVLGFIAGSCLALSGMSFQSLFRNPLAEPFTLGISAGATLGCVVCVTLGITGRILGFTALPLFAFAGALVSVFFVYYLTNIKKNFSTGDMLLAGIGVNFFFSALILMLQYFGREYNLAKIMHWTMGGVDIIGYEKIIEILPFVLIGLFFLFKSTRELNLLSVGEDIAVSRGVNVGAVKKIIFFSSSLMVGAVCAVCGPIAFVGMICPHIMRLIFGYDNRRLVFACFMFGGTFLVVCDTLTRTVIAPTELPVGIITSLLGGPFFIYLLFKKNK